MSVPVVLNRISKSFGGVHAVKDVSLEIPAGSATAVIGPNGAGKSTILKLICGTYRLDSGRIRIGADEVESLRPHQLARHGVGTAHQVPRPFRDLTVRQNIEVAVGASRRGADVEEVLQQSGLGDLWARPAGSLGVLDLKRLEVARALGCRPDVLLLDEIAAGLVGRELDDAIELVRAIHASGVTLILVEHVEAVVRELAERVVVMNWGEIIADGTPSEVAADDAVKEVYLGRRPEREQEPDQVAEMTPAPTEARRDPGAVVLGVTGLSAGYGRQTVLHDIDLEVGAGEVVAVLGANGAGKSTLCSALSGALPNTAGRIQLDDADLTSAPAHRRNRAGIAHCMEGRRLFPDLTVRENLELGAGRRTSRALVRRRLDDAVAMFPQVAAKLDHTAGSLSGGQQQMVAICRALMSDPRVLLCDEVSLGLAPIVIDELYAGLTQVRDRGTAIVLVEQNVERCLALADVVHVLNRGRFSFSGPPRLLSDPQALDTAYFGTPTDTTTLTKGRA